MSEYIPLFWNYNDTSVATQTSYKRLIGKKIIGKLILEL